MKITVGIIDDHNLFQQAIDLIAHNTEITVVMKASNGQYLRYRLEDGKGSVPDVMLIDTDMPLMNGIETTLWLRQHHPAVKLMAIAADIRDTPFLIKMFKAGCCGYLYKDFEPKDWLKAIRQVYTKGFYNAEANDMMFLWEKIQKLDKNKSPLNADRQRFLDLACTDLNFEQIRAEMNLTKHQANKHIDALFRKFHVTGRNGLVFEAMRKGYVQKDL